MSASLAGRLKSGAMGSQAEEEEWLSSEGGHDVVRGLEGLIELYASHPFLARLSGRRDDAVVRMAALRLGLHEMYHPWTRGQNLSLYECSADEINREIRRLTEAVFGESATRWRRSQRAGALIIDDFERGGMPLFLPKVDPLGMSARGSRIRMFVMWHWEDVRAFMFLGRMGTASGGWRGRWLNPARSRLPIARGRQNWKVS